MNRRSSTALTLALLACGSGLAAFGIGLYDDSVGTSAVIACGTSALLIFTWQGWREERDEADQGLSSYLPLAVFLILPIVYFGLVLFEEANDNDVLEDVIELAEQSCGPSDLPLQFVTVDVIEVGGDPIAVFNPPRGFPDDVALPAFAERAVDSQTGELRPTRVLCMSYPGRGPDWCSERTYLLRRVDAANTFEGSASATPLGDFDTVNSERFCEFSISGASSPFMTDVIEAAAAADQPLESFVTE